MILRSAKSLLPSVEFAERAYDCLEGADAAVVMTEWDEFQTSSEHSILSASELPWRRQSLSTCATSIRSRR
jgi:hypothetical protein